MLALLTQAFALIITMTQCVFAPAACEPEPVRAEPAPAWAWCGAHPDDANAATIARSLAFDGGIDATFGPCVEPDWSTYSPAFPGQRYVDPNTYMELVLLNASVGMQTVVYDARIWSTEPLLRRAAIDFWTPVKEHIAAWDMGDEFDPASDQWQVLIDRTRQVYFDVVPATGIHTYTNHLASAVGQALDDVPYSHRMLSFDQYWGDKGALIAAMVDHRTENLMCAVNALKHPPYVISVEQIEGDIASLEFWCDSYLIFGGVLPYQPTPTFGDSSLVDAAGNPTPLAAAVKRSTS